jgi:hypothetical protein
VRVDLPASADGELAFQPRLEGDDVR